MAFLNGSIGFERFHVSEGAVKRFTANHLKKLEEYVSGKVELESPDAVQVGFLGGGHLFDFDFDSEKNIINQAMHFGIRIDSHQVPAAIRKAWMQMELTAITGDNPEARPTKAQRQEAQEAVDQRCEDEIRTGKYHRMQQFPILWDSHLNTIYIGTSSASAVGHAADLIERAFEIEMQKATAGMIAVQYAEREKRNEFLFDTSPSIFQPDLHDGSISWLYADADNFDFLGLEFLLWLWWYVENKSDTIKLSDESEVTMMLTKTLALECPLGEWGKEVFSSESPIQLPEAMQALKGGKLPRKTGLILVREGLQYDFVLQAETLSVSGTKLTLDEDDADTPQDRLDGRIDAIRGLSDSIDLLFEAFLARRLAKSWPKELKQIQAWIMKD